MQTIRQWITWGLSWAQETWDDVEATTLTDAELDAPAWKNADHSTNYMAQYPTEHWTVWTKTRVHAIRDRGYEDHPDWTWVMRHPPQDLTTR